jgi:hypothetical protein
MLSDSTYFQGITGTTRWTFHFLPIFSANTAAEIKEG